MHNKKIIEEYREKRPTLEGLASHVIGLLRSSLAEEGIKLHDLAYRIKSQESLEYKISRPEKTYRSLTDVTDVVGLRIITYYESSIDDVLRLLERLLSVDLDHSTDKRKALDAQSFGYNSIHYICRVRPAELPEDLESWLAEVKFEIQIRTVLQHAWAEIEHDLGYKSEALVPQSIRRKFSRLAGLLEIVDEEFVSIRRFLADYERDLEATSTRAGAVPLDLLSLRALIRGETVSRLDSALAARLNKELSHQVFFPDYLMRMVSYVGLKTREELSRCLDVREQDIVGFLSPYLDFTKEVWGFGEDDMVELPRGYSILLACHLEVLEHHQLALKRIEEVTSFFRELDYPDDEEAARATAKALVSKVYG